MGKVKTKIIYSVLIVLILICSASVLISGYNKSAYTEYTYMSNVSLCYNRNDVYLIGTTGNKVCIDSIYQKKGSFSFSTSVPPSSYKLQGDTLVAICPSQDNTEIYLYDIVTKTIDVINIPKILSSSTNNYAFDGTYFYYIDSADTIRKISCNGRLVAKYKSDRNIQVLTSDLNLNIYAVCDRGLYEIKDDINLISAITYFNPIRFIDYNYFVDNNNNIYHKNSNSINYIGTFQSNNTNAFGGIIDNHIIAVENNTIYALDKLSCEKIKSYSVNGYVENLCVTDSKVFILVYSAGVPEIITVDINEFEDIRKNNNNLVTSDIYTIDNDNKTISGIPAQTTVAKFKKNISFDGYDINFVRFDNKTLDSGKIGTNATVTFKNDTDTFNYKLSVIGEVTGEGNLNSRDIKSVMRFILKTEEYNNAQLLAIDFNRNGEPDIVDLAYMVELCGNKK